MTCEAETNALKAKIEVIKTQFQTKLSGIADNAKNKAVDIDPDINKNDPLVYVGLNFDVKWHRVDWSMDLPTVFMADQEFSFDLPSVTMKTNEISFDLPTVRMERRQGPDYPEFTCSGLSCTVTWTHSYYDVPVIVMETQNIKMDLPEVTMATQKIVLGIPQVKMETHKFSFDMPDFILKNVTVEATKAKDAGDDLQKQTQSNIDIAKAGFVSDAQQQTGAEFSAFVDCQTNYLTQQLLDGLGKFDATLRVVQGFIDGLRGQKVPENEPQMQSLLTTLASTTTARATFDTSIHTQITALPNLHKKFVEGLLGQ